MLGTNITFEGVKGVGTIALELQPDQRVYTFIGVNGVGKTKMLEALFQTLLLESEHFAEYFENNFIKKFGISFKHYVFQKAINHNDLTQSINFQSLNYKALAKYNNAVVFIASQNRGFIVHKKPQEEKMGSFIQRKENYIYSTIKAMKDNFNSLNMDIDTEQWFTTLAQSSNPYQKAEDNREIEIKTVLKLLNQVDSSIDPTFLEISGDGRVILKIDNQKRELSHLSTGFASILKIIQAIVSGYSYFTNEQQLQNVKGIVLIDEIESHLHIAWQAQITPLLKRLFPNTTFYISTHSSIVLSQLEEGEAYRLQRDADGIVRTHLIKSPNNAAIVDVLKDAFGIDLNQMKLERMSATQQADAKQRLLALINQ